MTRWSPLWPSPSSDEPVILGHRTSLLCAVGGHVSWDTASPQRLRESPVFPINFSKYNSFEYLILCRLDKAYLVLSCVGMLGVGHQKKSEKSDFFWWPTSSSTWRENRRHDRTWASGLPDNQGKPYRKTKDFQKPYRKLRSKSQTGSKTAWNRTNLCMPYRRPCSCHTKPRHAVQMNHVQAVQNQRYPYRLVWNRGEPYRFGRWHPLLAWRHASDIYSVNSPDPYCGQKYLTFWNCAGLISGTMWSIFKNQTDYVSWHIWGYFRPSGLNRISILVLSITDWDLGMSIMTSLIFCHALILKPNISTSRWSTITILVSFFHKFCWSHIAFHKYCHN